MRGQAHALADQPLQQPPDTGCVFERQEETFNIRIGDYPRSSGEPAAVALVAEPEAQGAIVNLEELDSRPVVFPFVGGLLSNRAPMKLESAGLGHSICGLIQSFDELGIESTFVQIGRLY